MKDEKKTSKKSAEKRSKTPLYAGLVAIVMIWLGITVYRNTTNTGTTSGGTNQPAQDQATYKVLEYGTFNVTTSKITGVSVKPGEHILASPVVNCDYEWHVNGRKFMDIVGGKRTQYGINDPSVREHGYRLVSGTTGLTSVKWVYVRYIGDTDPDDSWFRKAQGAIASAKKQ